MTSALTSPDGQRLAAELIVVSRAFWARGWAPATSGNFSARLGENTVLVTASGLDKGELTEEGLLAIDLDGALVPPSVGRPSAETALHLALYRRFPDAFAVLHVHAPAATTLSMVTGAGSEVRLAGWEMLKALAGVSTHEHVELVPVVANDQDTQRLARYAGERLDRLPGAHAYLIAGHGLYTWGRSVAEARRHVEALEALFDLELRRSMIQGGSR
ncbi:Methylthioribulose-1-phosphate dehydratase [Minicystis rosea]|nr:Methylthioribulose-1-phosphate dehydratase [Minicystis rosea]